MHYRRDKWTWKGFTKGCRALRLRKVSPTSWAHSSCCIPWLMCQRHQICQLRQEHQNLFHCDITDMTACEITMSKAEGTDYLVKHLLGLSHPTGLETNTSQFTWQHSETRMRHHSSRMQTHPNTPPRNHPRDTQYNSTPILLGRLHHATHFSQLLDWSPKTGFAVYF